MSRRLKGSMEACGLRCLRLCLRLCLCALHLIKSWALFLKMLAKAFVAHTRTHTACNMLHIFERKSRRDVASSVSVAVSVAVSAAAYSLQRVSD